MDNPDVIILYAAAFMLCGPIVYILFVYKKIKLPGIDFATVFLQQLINVAPTYWKDL